jgi:ELWxxDGT repeat protein
MWLSSILGGWRTGYFRNRGRRQAASARRPQRSRLTIEPLENRWLPSTITMLTNALGGANPDNVTDVNGKLFFTEGTVDTGTQLWVSNGTVAGTVMLLDVGDAATGANIGNLTNVNGKLYFSADNGTTTHHNDQLWLSDGTPAGTVQITHFDETLGDPSPGDFANVNGTLFFTADDGFNGYQLWKSDGTELGTGVVKVINPTGDANPTYLTNVNGTLYFAATDGINGNELWKSDGTATGTVLVADIRPGSQSSNPTDLTAWNGILYFAANDGPDAKQLWRSDGTGAGTFMLADINPNGNSSPTNFTAVGSTLYFTATDGTAGAAHGKELWATDGTTAGTYMVADINPGPTSSNPANLTNYNGTLFFTANDGTNGNELWKSDGTTAGTVLVRDIRPGSASSSPTGLTVYNGTLYFAANDGTDGNALWASDGTANSTYLVAGINPGSAISFPQGLTYAGNSLFFSADDGVDGPQLYALNSSLANANYGFESPNVSGQPDNILYDPTTLPFLVYSGDAGVVANGSSFLAGSALAPEGNQVGFLQDTGSFTATVGMPVGTYVLSFTAAQRASNTSSQSFQIVVDGTVVGTFTPGSTDYNGYMTNSFTVAAPGVLHTVSFAGLNTDSGSALLIDQLALVPRATRQLGATGFEAPQFPDTSSAPDHIIYDPTGTPLSYNGDAGVVGNGSSFLGGAIAPQGTQVAFLQDTGSFTATLPFAAGTFFFSFQAAQRIGNDSSMSFQILVDGNVVSTITPGSTSFGAYASASFTLTGGIHTITFAGLDSDPNDAVFLDTLALNLVL